MGKDDNQIKIANAKGRPMLTWVGKRPLTSVRAYPAQLQYPDSCRRENSLAPHGRGQGRGET
jgi:adenine-specific DNA-methyltransferase